jgi:hypothetical protein
MLQDAHFHLVQFQQISKRQKKKLYQKIDTASVIWIQMETIFIKGFQEVPFSFAPSSGSFQQFNSRPSF